MEESGNMIEIKGMSFRYGKSKEYALRDINLSIKKNEFVALIGPSRAGKSTLCMSLNGLIPHSQKGRLKGSIVVNGKNTAENPVSNLFTDVAIVFQDFETQLFSTSASLDVAFGPENLGLPWDEIDERVKHCFERVDLQGFEMREPTSLSGGQKQRLAIAASLALHSPILVLDEPTTDLDPVGKERVLNIANDFRKSGDFTIVCVEHEIEELIYSDHVVLLVNGSILAEGSPREILSNDKLLRENGVMPLGASEVVHALGFEEPILTVDEAEKVIRSAGYTLDMDKVHQLIDVDNKRKRKYGDVIIDVKNVSFGYNKSYLAVNDVSLQIREGEFVALMGQNGSGKTTLAKQFNRLLKYQTGSLTIFGKDCSESSIYEISRNVGYVFQNPDHQIFADTIEEEVSFGPKNYGYTPEEIKEAVKEALEAVDMVGREKDDPFSLTKGERQRVAVASILAIRPKLLILDEPTTGLDYKEQLGIMNLLKRLNDSGTTVIIITHTMWVVSAFAHRAVVMNQGKIVFDGSVRDVYANEDELMNLHLKPPQVTQLGNRFGHALLSVEEARSCFVKGEDHNE